MKVLNDDDELDFSPSALSTALAANSLTTREGSGLSLLTTAIWTLEEQRHLVR